MQYFKKIGQCYSCTFGFCDAAGYSLLRIYEQNTDRIKCKVHEHGGNQAAGCFHDQGEKDSDYKGIAELIKVHMHQPETECLQEDGFDRSIAAVLSVNDAAKGKFLDDGRNKSQDSQCIDGAVG